MQSPYDNLSCGNTNLVLTQLVIGSCPPQQAYPLQIFNLAIMTPNSTQLDFSDPNYSSMVRFMTILSLCLYTMFPQYLRRIMDCHHIEGEETEQTDGQYLSQKS